MTKKGQIQDVTVNISKQCEKYNIKAINIILIVKIAMFKNSMFKNSMFKHSMFKNLKMLISVIEWHTSYNMLYPDNHDNYI